MKSLPYFCQKKAVNLTDRINVCSKLGEILRNPDEEKFRSFRKEISELRELVVESRNHNPWFTPENVQQALLAIGQSLHRKKTEKWLCRYPMDKLEPCDPKTIAVVMAGNIPLVGFHDYLSVMVTGNRFLGKLSGSDDRLLPLIHRFIEKIEPEFKGMATFTDSFLKDFDAVIATGSNNTARYFDFYFKKYPHIIRHNRNGVAVLTGQESVDELTALGNDIFAYYGLGCRNVSKLWVPEGYNFDLFFECIKDFSDVISNHKYLNNYDYNKSVFLVNRQPHLDNGFLLLREDAAIASPVAVVHYEKYASLSAIKKQLTQMEDQIQCVVSIDSEMPQVIPPGRSQFPQLWDYADGVDTVDFLINLE